MDGSSQRTWIGCTAVAAFSVRLAAMHGLAAVEHGLETAHEHHVIAENLVQGRGFSFNFFGPPGTDGPTSLQAPLVPALLTAFYAALGSASPAAICGMLMLQIGVSTLTVLALGAFAREASGCRRCGLAVGVVACVYPPLIVSPLHIQALVWNLFWLALLLLGAQWLRLGKASEGRCVLIVAAVLGMLTDPILASVVGVLLVAAVSHSRERLRTKCIRIAAISGVIALGLMPWTVRNYLVHGRLVLIKDSFPYVFWQGNHHLSYGTDKLLPPDGDSARLRQSWDVGVASRSAYIARRDAVSVDTVLSREERLHLASLPSEIARMDWFLAAAREQLLADPGHYARQCLRRLGSWIWFDASNPRSCLWHYRVSYLLLALLAGGGWLIEARRGRLTNWTMVGLPALTLTVVHMLIITSARFRIALELLLIPHAGIATVSAMGHVREVLVRARRHGPLRACEAGTPPRAAESTSHGSVRSVVD